MSEKEKAYDNKPSTAVTIVVAGSLLFSSCKASNGVKIEEDNLNKETSSKSEEGVREGIAIHSQIDSVDYGIFELAPQRCVAKDPLVSSIESDNSRDEVEINLSEEVFEILEKMPKMNFDDQGNLYFQEKESNLVKEVLVVETKRHKQFPYEQLSDVKFFVIHYDGAPENRASTGEKRTVFNTLNGLNSNLLSVNFCIDSYPLSNEIIEGKGLGVIQSQKPNEMPYKGKHVYIGYDTDGRPDLNSVYTSNLFSDLGVNTELVPFVEGGNKDFNSYSLSLEQVGMDFSKRFPDSFPPIQQLANVLGLVKAACERYGIKAWDVVGHHEIQEKADPGDEYMLTLRYLLGIEYIIEGENLSHDFLGTDTPQEYFSKLREYAVAKMGEETYMVWNEIYGMDYLFDN
jgi:hypothetical protein